MSNEHLISFIRLSLKITPQVAYTDRTCHGVIVTDPDPKQC